MTNPSEKRFKLSAAQMRPLVHGDRFCIASDRITVDGERVGYMYREPPDRPGDSGWRFFAGTETQAEVDDPRRAGAYAVNTIANYDPEIIPWLAAPACKAFGRDPSTGAFVEERYSSADAPEGSKGGVPPRTVDRHPSVHGDCPMTTDWQLTVPGYAWRRFEDDSLVLWRPGLTAWIRVFGSGPTAETAEERLRWLQQESSSSRFDEQEEVGGEILRWSYRLEEHDADGRAPALYGFVVGRSAHVQLAIYFDRSGSPSTRRVGRWPSASPSAASRAPRRSPRSPRSSPPIARATSPAR